MIRANNTLVYGATFWAIIQAEVSRIQGIKKAVRYNRAAFFIVLDMCLLLFLSIKAVSKSSYLFIGDIIIKLGALVDNTVGGKLYHTVAYRLDKFVVM